MNRNLLHHALLACALVFAVSMQAHAAGPYAFLKVTSTAADKCVVSASNYAPLVGEYDVVPDAYGGAAGCLVDVSGVPVGANSITAAAKSNLWGVLGVAVPFSYTRPDPASLLLGPIQLVK